MSPEGHFTDQILHLPATTSNTFTRFLDWLHFGSLAQLHKADLGDCWNCKGECDGSVAGDEIISLLAPLHDDEEKLLESILARFDDLALRIALYAFAAEWDIFQLQRAIIDQMWLFYQESAYPYHAEVITASKILPFSSPFLQLMVDSLARPEGVRSARSCKQEFRLIQKLPSNVLCYLWLQKAAACEKLGDLCTYHEHAQDEETVAACAKERSATRKRKRDELENEELLEAATT